MVIFFFKFREDIFKAAEWNSWENYLSRVEREECEGKKKKMEN